ncbi:uncharacterized protein EDB93DRAFT_1220626 [Suillus bovinus]|uniref:uncharacterized protein n=1 Tax=Suillus bovinus TaxID=48563 RepID=UPI001B85C879|nr:uncharacterized protein EDB93DRAFT_1220626 [Suillus bovinus]KAG2157608.1 hypothetical protein EDB93DRAFT_1220626 [Suillus bovinus]
MHVCLLPTETLLHIFAIIHEDYNSLISRAALAALARTCMTFKEPALDTLWKHIDGFEPLILCFPEGVRDRDVEGKMTLTRPLFAKEWSTFSQYAHRIRSLTFDSSEPNIIDDRIVQALISAPSSTPLPNLCRLHWLDDQECFIPLLRCLLVPTIRSIELRSNISGIPWSPSFAKSALLTSLVVRCPSVREFKCVYQGDSEDTSDVISDAVCGLREVFHLEAGVLNTQALLHLASLSSLKSLHFRTYNIKSTQTNDVPISLSQINLVQIAAPSLSVLAHCLRNVYFFCCRSVTFDIDSNWGLPYDPLVIPELIISLSEHFSPALEYFSFDFDPPFFSLEDEAILVNPRFALTFDAIAPLLSLSHLTKVDLDWICASAIDDASLKRMAQSWPLLQQFYFGSGCRWMVPPSLTFIGLIHLIQHCRDLRIVDMTFCACSVDTDSEPFSKTIPNKNISSIFVGMSPIVDPIAVACQLHTLMPNLTGVDRFGSLEEIRVAPQFQNFDEDWAQVDDFLTVLNTGAKMRESLSKQPMSALTHPSV